MISFRQLTRIPVYILVLEAALLRYGGMSLPVNTPPRPYPLLDTPLPSLSLTLRRTVGLSAPQIFQETTANAKRAKSTTGCISTFVFFTSRTFRYVLLGMSYACPSASLRHVSGKSHGGKCGRKLRQSSWRLRPGKCTR